jgi:hypothetical protein
MALLIAFGPAYHSRPNGQRSGDKIGEAMLFYEVGRGCEVGRGLGEGVGLGVAVGVGVGVAVDVGVGVTLGVGVGPPVTSKNAALIGPQVWKPWKSLTPRPCTKITWRPTDRLAVFMVASTATVGESNEPFIGMAVPPSQGGVSM